MGSAAIAVPSIGPAIATTGARQYVAFQAPVSYSSDELIAIAERSRGHAGSLVVILEKQRRNPYRRRVLRSMGLDRSHRTVVGPTDAWFTGQLRKVLDQVYVGYISPTDREYRGALKMTERMESYPQGEIVVFPEGQYLQVEVNGDYTTLLWPSTKPVEEILADLLATTGANEERLVTVGFESQTDPIEFDPEAEDPDLNPSQLEHTNISGLIDLFGSDGGRIAFIDIEMPEFLFTWTRDFRKFEIDGQPYPEVGMRFRRLPKSLDTEFQYIERTATPEVGAHAIGVLRNWSILRSSDNGR